ncbi:MAG TPA: DUF3667 domain-containing protein [Rhizomicrobium sp.]|jgi:hypothetical protein|nr:DUF3667 domain-containing protein [Rhizomicrobium sp.]
MADLEAILETSGAAAVEIAASAMAERGHQVHPCANCSKPMIGAYCAVCGQERDTNRRSVWGLVKVLVEDIVSFDSRIMRTGWALVTRPGELASAFREGRTQRYLPALRLYLFVSLIFFLILSFTNIAIMQLVVVATPTKITWINGQAFVPNPAYDKDDKDTQFMPKMMPMSKEKALRPGGHFEYSSKVYFFAPIGAYHVNLSPEARARLKDASVNVEIGEKPKSPDKAKAAAATKNWIETRVFDGLQRLASDPAALNGPLTTWIPRVLFLLLPIYALLLEIFYIRQRKTFYYVDHLIFSLTIHTFGFVLLMLAAAAAQFLSGETVALGMAVIGVVYTLIATRSFYRQNWFWTVVKFATVSFFYVFFCVFPALGVVIALSFLNV